MTRALRIPSGSPEETQELGRVIGALAQPGDIFLLAGPLGAGKTCLTQGIAWGMEVAGHVRSPTFVLMARYRGRMTLHHLDLYRIGDLEEAWDLGMDEQLFGEGVCVVEWADRAAELFPEDCLWIALDYGPGETRRQITFSGDSPRYRLFLEGLAAAFPVAEEVHP